MTTNHLGRVERVKLLKKLINEKILIIDGAMGTAIQDKNLTSADFGGDELEGCNEYLLITRPDVISSIHEAYLVAGADILESNTFGSTPLVLAEYDISDKAHEISFLGTKIAREMADKYTALTPLKPRFVAGSIGPTTKAITVTGGVSFEELIENFYIQAKGLYEGGCDYFLIETGQDTRNIKAAILACKKVNAENAAHGELPIAVSGTIEPMGTMLAGQNVEALSIALSHEDLLYIGLNCATGPDFMTDHIRTLAQASSVPVACVPNAGLPDENGKYLETPEMLANSLERFVKNGWTGVVGGCCGTTHEHIHAMAKRFENISPFRKNKSNDKNVVSFLSGIEPLEISDVGRPYIVGERTNVIGSKKFKELIIAEKYDEAAEIAKAQVKGGAHIIDVCLANPDRDEEKDMRAFLDKVIQKIKAPLMIDSTDEKVIELALTYSQGKAIVNSINLEDGLERFEKVCPILKKYGAAVVVGLIDDDPIQGMGVSVERKMEIAEKSFHLLTKEFGISPLDIYWDPLVFPVGTGDQNYVGSAAHTIKAIALLKEKYPQTKSVLGISNVSFGLPGRGREILNSVFLYHCVKSGLDLAIVNSEKLERFSSLSPEEIKLCDDLLFDRNADAIMNFSNYFRQEKNEDGSVRVKKNEKKNPLKELPLLERLPQYIIEGIKDGLYADLEEALKIPMGPLDIINGPLMKGMDVVGKLFNENKLIVAEVLQSAEAMKAAVSFLEPLMEKNETSKKGKIVLATVKGDVHDIGKNLVDIVLSNNGFEVINLGIKIPSEKLIEAIKEHAPSMVGLSGLLVKSAQQMVITAEDLSRAGVNVPILVGGAALSRNFTNKKIAKAYDKGVVIYAKDAMDGLDLANKIVVNDSFIKLKEKLALEQSDSENLSTGISDTSSEDNQRTWNKRSTSVISLQTLPLAPDFERHVIKNTPFEIIFDYINPLMILGRHLGVKGNLARLIWEGKKAEAMKLPQGEKAVSIYEELLQVKEIYQKTHLKPKAVYQFFKVKSFENEIRIYDATETSILQTFIFPRQPMVDGLCLSDYVDESRVDTICLFVVSVGEGIREESQRLKESGDYFKSHALQALALESAEAYAEYLHTKIRATWGFADPIDMTMMQRFQAKYHGKRYSFGYPACPNLEDQEKLFSLLRPQELGIELTDGFMMDPEASVSAIVFHHPHARYFSSTSTVSTAITSTSTSTTTNDEADNNNMMDVNP